MIRSNVLLLLLFLTIITQSCTKQPKVIVKRTLPGIDSYSSVRTIDLTGDGMLDIIIGAGAKENLPSDSAVIALDGRTLKVLWMTPGRNQYVGSAIFKDINNDGTEDIFIGGRWAEFKAISGRDGKVIWEFLPDRSNQNPADSGWFNFTTPQFIPDQDGDRIDDILVANGGDARAWPTKTERPAGRLMVMSALTGKVLSYATVPDGKETYLSPVCADIDHDGVLDIIFGTGGETIGGHLYRTTLPQLMKGDILEVRTLAVSNNKGFVGPPILVDVTGDHTLDVVANVAEGKIIAVNGLNDSLIWEVEVPYCEIYNSPGVGFFNNDSIPDFIGNFGRGRYPNYNMQYQVMIDGSNGMILFKDSIGEFQYASPVTFDSNGDGYDEALLTLTTNSIYIGSFSHLMLVDFRNGKKQPLGDTLWRMNYSPATPWVGDLDGDNKLEIVYTASKILDAFEKPDGLTVVRFNTAFEGSAPAWGAYMGNNYQGVYKPK